MTGLTKLTHRRLLQSALSSVLALAMTASCLPPRAEAASAPALSSPAGPQSVADLAEGLLDAVVNISTSQNVKDDDGSPAPQIQEGAPFEDLFEDYYKGGGNSAGSHTVSSLGSGFVIDPAGYIVTNNHVIEGADAIEVIFAKGNKLKAKLIGTDVKTDLSLLKVESPVPLKAVPFGDSRKIRIGDWVMAIGNPFGLGGSVSVGIVSARGRNINAGPYDNFIQTDAAINKGNSGGPLFNMYGEVIGINTAIISPSGGSIGIGFSVPSEIASTVIDQLKQFGETRRGWLGVRVQPVTEDVAASLGLQKIAGALVSGIVKGGPVENGPIKTGDVIVTFDGKPIAEMRDLLRIVAESPTGKDVAVEVIRDGKPMTLSVKLGRMEDKAEETPAPEGDPALPETDGEEGAVPDEGTDGYEVQPPAGEEEQQTESGDDADGTAVPDDVLGMVLSPMDEGSRKDFSIAAQVKGAVVQVVIDGSPAAEKGIKEGDTIVEVAQTAVKDPEAVAAKIRDLKKEGRRNALLLVASPNGDLRTIALPIE